MDTLLAIPNLSSLRVARVNPWSVDREIPEEAAKSKSSFIRWCQKPTTQGCHFSAAEGLDPLQRIGKDNPVVFLQGFIADYDAPCDADMIANLIKNSPTEFIPNWVSSTFSGGARLIWLFEEPLTLADSPIIKSFLKVAKRELKLTKILPGFDEEAWLDVSKYYERGRDWRNLCNDRISAGMVHQWMYKAGDKVQWNNFSDVRIPMETLAEEVTRRFPRRWGGPFEAGRRGCRFWDDQADNSTAAVIRESGMQCFTGDQAFVPWAQILGPEFVRKFEAERTGEIIHTMFYDGRNYWREDSDKLLSMVAKDDMRLALKVKYGLSSITPRSDTFSAVEKVLHAIQEQKSVVAALPFVHFPRGVHIQDNKRYLNTASVECMKPVNREITEWGDGFPWLAGFLGNIFATENQLPFFLSWWKHFYINALNWQPRTGQAVFIAGAPGVGKTFLSTGLISRTVGGHCDASAYLLGDEKFTSHVVSKPIMSVDDTSPAEDNRRHSRYSAMIKKVVANRHQHYEEKFMAAGQVEWLGRVVVTCNLDAESIRLLPNVDMSILDKIMLFRCGGHTQKFPDSEALEGIIAEELPHLCAYLIGMEVPEHCVGDARFGIAPFHDPLLYGEAQQTSASFSFWELLVDFLSSYAKFAEDQSRGPCWKGTATALLADMALDERIGGLASKYTPTTVATLLGQLRARGYAIDKTRSATKREWVIPFSILGDKEDAEK